MKTQRHHRTLISICRAFKEVMYGSGISNMKHGVVIEQFHTQHMHVNACLPSEGHGVTECLAERGRGGGDAEVHATGSMMWQAREGRGGWIEGPCAGAVTCSLDRMRTGEEGGLKERFPLIESTFDLGDIVRVGGVSGSPVAASHTRVVLSELSNAIFDPSGENATDTTASPWPVSGP